MYHSMYNLQNTNVIGFLHFYEILDMINLLYNQLRLSPEVFFDDLFNEKHTCSKLCYLNCAIHVHNFASTLAEDVST